ncbi:hypothetical protein pb186bvf_018438 [Paramecium bursaria]
MIKSKYKTISSDERSYILKQFIDRGLTATQVSQETGHNLSTIKAIFRVYKKEGRVHKKLKRDMHLKLIRHYAVLLYDDEKSQPQFEFLQAKRKITNHIIREGQDCQDHVENELRNQIDSSKVKVLQYLNSENSRFQFIKDVEIALKHQTTYAEINPTVQKIEKNLFKLATELKKQFENTKVEPDLGMKLETETQKMIDEKFLKLQNKYNLKNNIYLIIPCKPLLYHHFFSPIQIFNLKIFSNK